MGFEFFSVIDLISFFAWLIIFMIGAYFVYTNNKEKPAFKFYLTHFYWKILLGVGFGLVYILYYERHGDTVFYWDGAQKLNLLLFDNPSAYIQEIFSTPSKEFIPSYFSKVGSPPWWIYKEPNSWFVSKIANFLSFFTFGSYLTLNLFFSVISGWISWRFFRYMDKILTIETRYLALACLFIPSVGFWCSGLIKDTIAICSIFGMVISLFKFMRKDYKSFFWNLVVLAVSIYCIYSIRPFLLLATLAPCLFVFVFRLNRTKPFIIKMLTRVVGFTVSVVAIAIYFRTTDILAEYSAGNVLKTAEVIQKDLINNQGYTGKKYDLGITEFSNAALVSAIPSAIAVSLFRPFIWEADSVFMLLNGFENLLILFLTVRLIWAGRNDGTFKSLLSNDFFLYAFLFILVLGYFVGLTSGLFGTLVRLKAPIMPFFLILVFYRNVSVEKDLLLKRINKETSGNH